MQPHVTFEWRADMKLSMCFLKNHTGYCVDDILHVGTGGGRVIYEAATAIILGKNDDEVVQRNENCPVNSK